MPADDAAVAAHPPALGLSPFAQDGAMMDEDFSDGEEPGPEDEKSRDPLDEEVDGLDMTLEEAILAEYVPIPPLMAMPGRTEIGRAHV